MELFTIAHTQEENFNSAVDIISRHSGCRNVGIRVLDREGFIPYKSFTGFSKEWWNSENWLSRDLNHGICSRVIRGELNSRELQISTSGGSFQVDNFIEFSDGLSENEKIKYRDACVKCGFESMAVIPIRHDDTIIGALHIADEKPAKFSREFAESLEHASVLIGEAIHRFGIEEELNRINDTTEVINSLLHLQMQDIPLDKVLKQALNGILSIPWLSLMSKGCIFLVDHEHEVLVMKTHRGFSGSSQRKCKEIPLGTCHCGRAGLTGKLEFFDKPDERHEIRSKGIKSHGNYCVPIRTDQEIFGIINLYLKEGHRRKKREKEFLTAVADTLAGIIARRQAEEKLKKDKDYLEKLTNSMGEAIFTVKMPERVIEYVNNSVEFVFGYKPDECIGKATQMFYPGEEEYLNSNTHF